MRLPRVVLSVSTVAALLAAAALPCTGCKGKESGAGAAASAPTASASAPSRKKTQALPAPSARARRFDAKIAENLARVPDPEIEKVEGAAAGLDNQAFRDRVVAFVRSVSAGGERVRCDVPLSSKRPFRPVVWIYREGQQVGRGEGSSEDLCAALEEATRQAVAATGADREVVAGGRFVVELPGHDHSMVEHAGKGVELTHGLAPVRVLDKALLARRIEEGEAYLLRVIDRERKGVHKYYHAPTDRFEPELHTIYTASTALTLLELHAYRKDPRLLDLAKGLGGFMLEMQRHEERDRTAGAFYYSFDLERQRPEHRLVVGTASKSIFTLLELHALTKEKKWLDAATRAADWLITMQEPDGRVRSHLSQRGGGPWQPSRHESMLYTGQVLSALSRMHRATRETRFVEAASATAGYLARRVAERGCFLGDDYRKPNPISSSWVVLSLLDFVKAAPEPRMEEMVFRCATDLTRRQWLDARDVYRHGRWQRAMSSSGNGWLAEVLSEVYLFCRERGRGDCDRFKDSAVAATRLLLQYTYTPESDFVVKNPGAADGGVFWSVRDRYVRTDSVCHAMNAYLNLMPHLGDGPLVTLPEPPLDERLALDREAPVPGDESDRDDDDEQPGKNEDPAARGADPTEEGQGRGGAPGPLKRRPGPPRPGPPRPGPPGPPGPGPR